MKINITNTEIIDTTGKKIQFKIDRETPDSSFRFSISIGEDVFTYEAAFYNMYKRLILRAETCLEPMVFLPVLERKYRLNGNAPQTFETRLYNRYANLTEMIQFFVKAPDDIFIIWNRLNNIYSTKIIVANEKNPDSIDFLHDLISSTRESTTRSRVLDHPQMKGITSAGFDSAIHWMKETLMEDRLAKKFDGS